MTPREALMFIEANLPEQKVGFLNVDDYERLLKRRQDLEAKGVKVL